MNWVAGTQNPVVVSGNVITEALNYKCKAGQTFKAGELIRLTSAATVAVANPTSATTGSIHGIALANAVDYLAGGDHAGEPIPVGLIDKDTVLAIQTNGAKTPADLPAGALSELDVTSNYWSVTDVATSPVVQGYGQPADAAWFDAEVEGSKVATAPVYVTVLESVLTGVRVA